MQEKNEPAEALSPGAPVPLTAQPSEVLPAPPSASPPQDTEQGMSRLAKIEQRIAQLEAQKRAILAREKEKIRKERTRRLIQIGAIALKYLNLPDEIQPADFERVMQRIVAALGQKSAPPPEASPPASAPATPSPVSQMTDEGSGPPSR